MPYYDSEAIERTHGQAMGLTRDTKQKKLERYRKFECKSTGRKTHFKTAFLPIPYRAEQQEITAAISPPDGGR